MGVVLHMLSVRGSPLAEVLVLSELQGIHMGLLLRGWYSLSNYTLKYPMILKYVLVILCHGSYHNSLCVPPHKVYW